MVNLLDSVNKLSLTVTIDGAELVGCDLNQFKAYVFPKLGKDFESLAAFSYFLLLCFAIYPVLIIRTMNSLKNMLHCFVTYDS